MEPFEEFKKSQEAEKNLHDEYNEDHELTDPLAGIDHHKMLVDFFNYCKLKIKPKLDLLFTEEFTDITAHEFLGSLGSNEHRVLAMDKRDAIESENARKEAKVMAAREEQFAWDMSRRRF